MKILLIETATQICSAVLSVDGGVVARRESDTPNAHSTCLSVFVDEVLREGAIKPHVCYALGIPLLSVPTLLSMAALYYRQYPDYRGLVCPMIDARRMECYTMVVDSNMNILRDTSADVIEAGCFDEWLDRGEVTFIGDGAEKTHDLLGAHPNARYDSSFQLSAEGMLKLAEVKLRDGKVEDVAYFEPFYLKDFVAKKSVVHGLR